MRKKLIINSDDLGITEGVTLGTIQCHKDGVLTSTTAMMNMPFVTFALEEAKKYPKLGVGIHLVLTAGRPLLSNVPSLTDENGDFLKQKNYENNKVTINPDELYNEWKAQIELFIKMAGKKPTHIDSHHHVHNMKNHREVAMKLAMEYNLPIRQDEPFDDRFEYAHFNDRFYGDNLTVDCLIDQIKMSKHEITEFMAHPAYLDQRLYEISRYNFQRMKEMEILRSEKIKSFIDENNIELINYNALSRA